MIDYTLARSLADRLSALGGDMIRMEVVQLLLQQRRSVGELADLVGIPMMNMSHHLGIMRSAGIVEVERQGRHKIYSLAPEMLQPKAPPGALGKVVIASTVEKEDQQIRWEVTVEGYTIKAAKKKKTR